MQFDNACITKIKFWIAGKSYNNNSTGSIVLHGFSFILLSTEWYQHLSKFVTLVFLCIHGVLVLLNNSNTMVENGNTLNHGNTQPTCQIMPTPTSQWGPSSERLMLAVENSNNHGYATMHDGKYSLKHGVLLHILCISQV